MKNWPKVTPTTKPEDAWHYVCLVHYHEIGLKGKNRSRFERQLIVNLKAALSDLDVVVRRISGYVCIAPVQTLSSSQEQENLAKVALERALRIPGVARATLALRTTQVFDVYAEAAKVVLSEAIAAEGGTSSDLTFKVHAKRSATDYQFHTLEIHQMVGSVLCEAFPQLKVDVHKPRIVVHILVHQSDVYVYAYSKRGVGGLPVGTAGKVVSLFSSGIDSPVATWMLGRRGATMIPVHFSGRPMVAPDSEDICLELCRTLNASGVIPRLYVVPFGEVQREIALSVAPSLRILMYRRMMYAAAEGIAQKEHARALCTGESLGQVASQTLENIYATAEIVKSLSILRPLIGMDKQEIIAWAEKLDTFSLSSRTAPDCCTLFMPKQPETHARIQDIQAAWDKLPSEDMLKRLLESVEITNF